jgi:DnaJ-domain-containing protein 1
MTDAFATLGQPRRPWLDADQLKQAFLQRTAAVHPDRVRALQGVEQNQAQDQSASLNAAYQTLLDPKQRLQHLIQLEWGPRPAEVQEVPPELMDLFMEVGQLFRKVDAFLGQRAAVTSPLLRVQLFGQAQEWISGLQVLQSKVRKWQDSLVEQLKDADQRWHNQGVSDSSAREQFRGLLEELCRRFSFCGRWLAQIQERVTQLSF